MAAMQSDLRLECQSLLHKLKTSQQELSGHVMSQSGLTERTVDHGGNSKLLSRSDHEGNKQLLTNTSYLKPAYARDKLCSVVQGHLNTKGHNLTSVSVRENKENIGHGQPKSCLSKAVKVSDYGQLSTSAATRQSNNTEMTSCDRFPCQPKTADFAASLTSQPVTPNTQRRRDIIDRHTNVPTRLDAEELRELNNVRKLNFNYSQMNPQDPDLTQTYDKRQGHGGHEEVDVRKASKKKERQLSHKEMQNIHHQFKEQLEDDGNNRKLNHFIRDTTIKAKSLLNSTDYSLSNLNSSRRNNSRVTFNTTQGQGDVCPDQRLLGYDWIAALLDNDSHLVDQSESFFNDLREFRRAHKNECSNQFYMAGPHTLVDFEPEPVVEALREPKVQPYIVNQRLFTEPFRSGLIDYQDENLKQSEKREPTADNPRFVRVSIPRSTLETPYRVKPHRRRSFDASDSCALMDHCLLGWENSIPTMMPTAKALDINTESGRDTLGQTTTLAEAEDLAQNYRKTLWPYDRPGSALRPLPSWRKHYMDTTLNMSVPTASSTNPGSSRNSGGSGSVKRVTDKLLNSTYATMYEMERVKEERKLEMSQQQTYSSQDTST